MSNPHGLKVGDRLYVVRGGVRHSQNVPTRFDWFTVAKVGRKYATLDGLNDGRVDLSHLGLLTYGGGHAYRSPEEYTARVAAKAAWKEMLQLLEYRWVPRFDVTAERITQASILLGLTEKA